MGLMFPKIKRKILGKQEWHDLTILVYERDKWTCRICGCKRNLTPDHIVKRSQGGDDAMENIWTLCADCHRRKDERKLTQQEIALIPIGSKCGEPCEFRIRR